MTKSLPLTTDELVDHIAKNPIDCTRHSRQLLVDYGDIFHCTVNLSTLTLAALFNGYIVVPLSDGRIFRFCKFSQ